MAWISQEDYEYSIGDAFDAAGKIDTQNDDENLSNRSLERRSTRKKRKPKLRDMSPTNGKRTLNFLKFFIWHSFQAKSKIHVNLFILIGESLKVPRPKKQRCKIDRNIDLVFGLDHLPEISTKKSPSRCKICQRTTYILCPACDICLCFVRDRNCYKQYHLKKFE